MMKLLGVHVYVWIAIAFFAGGALGSVAGNQRVAREVATAVEKTAKTFHDGEMDREARNQASQAEALIEQNKKTEQHLKEQHALEMAAEENAHAALEAERAAIARDAAAARAQLAKERETTDGLRNVAGMLADSSRLCGSAELRLRLDAAAGAASSAAGDRDHAATDPAAAPAAGAAPAPQAGEPLTCEQLRRGYITLGGEYRAIAKQLDEIITWDERVLGAKP